MNRSAMVCCLVINLLSIPFISSGQNDEDSVLDMQQKTVRLVKRYAAIL
ncbi:hypothetical protein C8N47_109157 [Mangrovibacterium marinum]|uniref:Uncharacterized protein n=1 Tax=Mangrovibacterium marinum TaxID=1639118 RepID=A0A2T5C1F8_9BACT|nr:hypothetical protein C8N47_109157 [Mangrovibacterium marinum]